ncbi:MAG: metal-dependent transcriptional regulator [Lachnospiraceae bacterium]|nr:metal-dependent transcriptional regulator [Lachnospiraceae bacterium]
MNVNESAENYLETIYRLSKKLPVVRSVDIATELNFTKPSVSVAMKNLRQKGHIEVSSAGFITLTESGLAIGESIYERHEVISHWLETLGVDAQIASDDACRMEHVLSKETFDAIKRHIKETSTSYSPCDSDCLKKDSCPAS